MTVFLLCHHFLLVGTNMLTAGCKTCMVTFKKDRAPIEVQTPMELLWL